jgi:hypothetical protein
MGYPRFERPPVWLLPNVFALDAPVVAIVWQRFLTQRFEVFVPAAATIALGATVWCIYLTDHLLDARRGCLEADRHLAASRWPVSFAAAVIASAAIAVFAAINLSADYFRHGLVLSVAILAYLALVHLVRRAAGPAAGLKELFVATVFAAGVAIPLSVESSTVITWLPSIACFAGLCWLNCRLIDRLESAEKTHQKRPWGDDYVGVVLQISCVALPPAIALAVSGSLFCLLLVSVICRYNPRPARVLADAALLVPLSSWFIP